MKALLFAGYQKIPSNMGAALNAISYRLALPY